MQERKSFIIHKDSLSVLDELTDAQAGQLFKAIKSFQDGEDFELDNVLRIAFASFKNQFIRDSEKYRETVERRREAGSKGGNAKQQNIANASKCKQNLANLADSVSKNDSKNDSDSKKEVIPYQLIADAYNEHFSNKTGNPRVEKLTKPRMNAIKKLWLFDTNNSDSNKLTNSVDYWIKYFTYCSSRPFFQPDFQRGEAHKDWKPNFDFVMREKTLVDMKEGKY